MSKIRKRSKHEVWIGVKPESKFNEFRAKFIWRHMNQEQNPYWWQEWKALPAQLREAIENRA